jgi:hypothetical protein
MTAEYAPEAPAPYDPPVKFAKILGGFFLVMSGASLLLAVGMYFDPLDGASPGESISPGLFFAGVSLIPGLTLTLWARAKEKAEREAQRLLGFVRSSDVFTGIEVAKHVGGTPAEAEEAIQVLAARTDVDLVFHSPDRTWMHRARIKKQHSIISKCGSCGGNVGSQVVFVGETVSCQYCGTALT